MSEKMDLRDQFAMAVLKGMQVNSLGVRGLGDRKSDEFIELLADTAYRIADAFMSRRLGPSRPKRSKLDERVAAIGKLTK